MNMITEGGKAILSSSDYRANMKIEDLNPANTGTWLSLESFSLEFLWSQFQISFHMICAVIRIKTKFVYK